LTSPSADSHLHSTLKLYTNELFGLVEDNLRIQKEIDYLIEEKGLKELDLSRDDFDEDEFEVVELKVMLESNQEEYQEVLDRIRKIYKLISTGTTESQFNIQRAKYMRRRVEEIKFSNLCLKEEVFRNKDALEQHKIS
jgi:hypothetical protein